MKKKPKINIGQLIELHGQGLSVKEIEDRTGWNHNTIYQRLNDLELKPNKKPRKKYDTRAQKPAGRPIMKASDVNGYGLMELACAIVTNAAVDYRRALRANASTFELKRFFRSSWYQMLCQSMESPIDGERVIETLEKQYENRRRKNVD